MNDNMVLYNNYEYVYRQIVFFTIYCAVYFNTAINAAFVCLIILELENLFEVDNVSFHRQDSSNAVMIHHH